MAWPLSDNFNRTAGDNVQVGNTALVQHQQNNNPSIITANGQARPASSASSKYYWNDAPTSADYAVEGDIYNISSPGTSYAARLCFRVVSNANTDYQIGYTANTGWIFYRFNNGTATQIGSTITSKNIPLGSSMHVKIVGVGSNLKIYIDNATTPDIDYTDPSPILDAGYAGFRILTGTTIGDSVGIQLDNFSAAYLSGGSSVTVTDSGAGTDAINQILASLSITDSGNGADGFGSLAAAVPLTESAYGSDSISQILAALTVTDTSTSADGLSVSALVPVADSGSGADTLAVLTALLKLVTDAGAGADAVSISVAPVVVADSGSGTDTLAVRAAVTITDMGTGTDTLNLVTALLKVVADAATGNDGIGGVTVAVPVTDTGHGLDTIGALAVLARVLDVATGVDAVIRISGDGPDKQVIVTFTTRSAAVGFASKSAGITFN